MELLRPFSGFIDINGCSWGSATDFHRTVDDCTDVSTDGKDQLVGIVGALSDVQVAAFVPAGYGKGAIPRTYIAGTCVQQSCLPGVIKPIGSSRSKELAVGGRGDGDLFPHPRFGRRKALYFSLCGSEGGPFQESCHEIIGSQLVAVLKGPEDVHSTLGRAGQLDPTSSVAIKDDPRKIARGGLPVVSVVGSTNGFQMVKSAGCGCCWIAIFDPRGLDQNAEYVLIPEDSQPKLRAVVILGMADHRRRVPDVRAR